MTSVLRLGVYRERIEKYGGRVTSSNDGMTTGLEPVQTGFPAQHPERVKDAEELLTVTLERQPGRQLGIRLSSGNQTEPGIFIADIQVCSVKHCCITKEGLGITQWLKGIPKASYWSHDKKWLGVFVCAYHPAALGSSPKHAYIICSQMCTIFVTWKQWK